MANQRVETPAPFSLDPGNDWVIFQSAHGSVSKVWACLGGEMLTADGYDANAIIHVHAAIAREIPPHWLVLPTGCDLQTHLRFPGQDSKETLRGGLMAAFAGGYDSVLSMPNTNPFLDDPALLKETINSAGQETEWPVEVFFTAAGTVGMQGQEPADIAALAKAGAAAITDDGWGVREEAAMDDLLKRCAEAGMLFMQHAEMPGHKGVATASAFQKGEGLPEYPRLAESAMVERDLKLLKKHPKARYHVLHVSTRETLRLVAEAKKAGLPVTAEASPHHLYFCNEDIPAQSDARSTCFKMNPPLFGPEDREALRAALREGVIDCVSTDHAPHEKENKALGWIKAPFGTRGLETTIPVLLHLWREGALSWERVEEVWSTVPRKILGRASEPRGWLFIDPDAEYVLSEQDLPGISKNSCFLGQPLKGRIEWRGEPEGIWTRD